MSDDNAVFRAKLAAALNAVGLQVEDLWITDAAASYGEDPAFYGPDPVHTLVLHAQYNALLQTPERDVEQMARMEVAIFAARGEPPPFHFSPKERAELRRKIKAAARASRRRSR